MLKIELTDVYGWEAAIRGMRNPLNSWSKSDSFSVGPGKYHVGEADLALMLKLAKAGPEHAKYLRMIYVSADITGPLYWWAEYDTYKVGTVANSCSKMHKLLHRPFEMKDFSFDKLIGYKKDVKQFLPEIDEESEIWRSYDADYFVSSQGRLRRGSRILSGSLHEDGYRFTNLHGRQIPIHRIVAEIFVPNVSDKKEVNHIDGNKQNNRAENLEWVTRSENQKHAVDTGLQPRGLSGNKGKFTAEQREEIKRLNDEGVLSRRQLADRFGVSHTCICDIVNDKYRYADKVNIYEEVARPLVDTLNELRDAWLVETDEEKRKAIWYSILQMLPESYNQKRTVELNYAVLAGIYRQRKGHKLDEWHTFCEWIEGLPYSELITGERK